MKIDDLRKQDAKQLNEELLSLRREQFNLRMQRATDQGARPHDFQRVRRDIARIKTVLSERRLGGDAEGGAE